MRKLLSLIFLSLVFASCSDSQRTAEPLSEAGQRGRADARALCQANLSAERDLHAALLAIKAREWDYRTAGDTLAANAYISAFRDCLRQTNQALADKVL